jgi:hypothetical protein
MKKKISLKLIVCLLALIPGKWMVSCCDAAEAAAAGMVLEVGTPWVVADGQPEAVQRALKDVEKDWYKVFGRRPVILKDVPASWHGPVIYLGLTGAWREQSAREKLAGAESFMLRAQRDLSRVFRLFLHERFRPQGRAPAASESAPTV